MRRRSPLATNGWTREECVGASAGGGGVPAYHCRRGSRLETYKNSPAQIPRQKTHAERHRGSAISVSKSSIETPQIPATKARPWRPWRLRRPLLSAQSSARAPLPGTIVLQSHWQPALWIGCSTLSRNQGGLGGGFPPKLIGRIWQIYNCVREQARVAIDGLNTIMTGYYMKLKI